MTKRTNKKRQLLTRGNVVVRLDGEVIGKLHEVDSLQDGQTLANRSNTYLFKVFRAHDAEHIASQVVLWSWDETMGKQ